MVKPILTGCVMADVSHTKSLDRNGLESALRREAQEGTSSCPNMESCQMFPLLSMSGTLKIWKARYCSADYESCERYKATEAGRPVAPDLLPNGVRLGDRKRET